MPSDLEAAVQRDHTALRTRLERLVGGTADAAERDAFLDAWIAYSTAVGLVLYEAATHHLEAGAVIVDRLRKSLPAFQQAFADLENADSYLKAIAARVAPAFEAQLDGVMNELVVKLCTQLDEPDLVVIAKRYRRVRSGD